MSTDRRSLLEESLAAIQRLQARVDAAESARHEPIAIVGAGCRYPGGADTPEAYWELLKNGVDAVAEVPPDRWNVDDFYDPDAKAPGKMITRRGGFLRQVDRFDPASFGISPREAESLDPQQRLLLETALEALESAAISPETLVGSSTGVFVGITTNDYGSIVRSRGVTNTDVYSATGNALNAAAGRISFTFGFQGPAVAVDTACSSSLVAVHLAVRALRNGEADLALAAGVNVVLSPDAMIMFSKWGMLAPDGRCKTFDADADGFVRAEGCAMIALKRLSSALADGDPILAVIRGSAVNQDGRSSGLTVPNGPAQAAVLRRALLDARLDPSDIDYVEAHGTGTPLGDPIEIEAIGTVIGSGRAAADALIVGSVKTNLGHTEAASGLAGLLKVALSLQHEAIPPHLHFTTQNPGIPWERFALKVPTSLLPWRRGERPRRAGVSSFGFSGTNAHVILEEAPLSRTSAPAATDTEVLVPLSARDEKALHEVAGQLADFIARNPTVSVADVALTHATGRSHLNHRLSLLAEDSLSLERDLRAFATGDPGPGLSHGSIRAGERPKIAFLFTGQGAQYAGMGKRLYETEPVFRAALDRCAQHLTPLLGTPLLDVMFGPPESTAMLSETAFTQPALFALEFAIAELWASWGITPSAVLGHSVGEYVAAVVAGAMSLEDGLTLVAARGRLMQALPAGGDMAAIFADEARVAPKIAVYGGRVSIAGLNGPEETVISGDADAVGELVAAFQADGIKSHKLEVSHAFHSHRLDPMLAPLERQASTIKFSAPRIALISNLTGAAFSGHTAPDGSYWRRHAREPVQFAKGLQALRSINVTAVVEIGPHPTLLALASRSMPDAGWTSITSLRRQRDDRREMLTGLGALYTLGASIKWNAVAPSQARRIALPTYPFQRDRYWVARSAPARALQTSATAHPLLGDRQRSPEPAARFLAEVGRDAPSFLADHVVLENTLLPGTGYIEIGLAAARALGATGAIAVQNVVFETPLALEENARYSLHTTVDPEVDGSSEYVVRSAGADVDGDWRVHARGTLRTFATAVANDAPSVQDARSRCVDDVDVDAYYDMLERNGLRYGTTFRGVRSLKIGQNEAVGFLEAPADSFSQWSLHPAVLDAAFHLVGAALLGPGPTPPETIFLPIGIDEVYLERAATHRVWATTRLRSSSEGGHIADLRLEDENGDLLATVTGLQLRRATTDILARALSTGTLRPHSYRMRWTQIALENKSAEVRGRVLVVSDSNDAAESLSRALAAAGATSMTCRSIDVAAANGQSVDDLLRGEGENAVAWVIDCSGIESRDEDVMPMATRARYSHLLNLAKTMATAAPNAGLCVLTRGAQFVAPGDDVDPSRAALLGLSRTIGVERAEAPSGRIDLDSTLPLDAQLPTVVAALASLSAVDPEIAVRGGAVFAPRVDDSPSLAAGGVEGRDVLRIRERGSLDALTVERDRRRPPDANETEIEIRAAGLNFRDVLNALGMYPGDPGPLGSECSGVITAIGPNVHDLAVGDEVIAFGIESIASHATVPADLVIHKPSNIGFAEAVTIPNAYVTAAVSFAAAGEIRPGQRVLVHAAAGGVGLAALRLARRAGAEVIATASSAQKRAFAIGQGASLAFDSRSASFADDVLRATGGEGVDVILNSLSGELIDAGMRVLRPGGAFIEIGKNAIWTAEQAAERYPQVRYRIVDLGVSIQDDVDRVRNIFIDVVSAIASGQLAALPVHAFALADAAAAFRFMAAARHTGKVVLVPQHDSAFTIRPAARYLVTGAFGGLGFAAAEWLAARGATDLVLVGRRDPNDDQKARIDHLRAAGVRITTVKGDVADRDTVRTIWRDMFATGAPLRGIVHTAGVLSDAELSQQDAERFDVVARPKVDGTWNLHEEVSGNALDFFAMFSSSSALFGSRGQANYAAANAFLDGLAAHRRSHGQVATSIGWGAWAEIGMAARLSDATRGRWSRMGFGQLSPDEAFAALERVLSTTVPYAAITAMDAQRVAAHAGTALRALLGPQRTGATTPTAPPEVALRERLLAAEAGVRRNLLRQHVRGLTARVLGVQNAASLRDDEPLRQMGLDSLMAIELRNHVQATVRVTVSVADLLAGPTIDEFIELIMAQLPVESTTVATDAGLVRDVDELSDAEVDAALAELLRET